MRRVEEDQTAGIEKGIATAVAMEMRAKVAKCQLGEGFLVARFKFRASVWRHAHCS